HVDLGLALADLHHAAATQATADAPQQKQPDSEKQQRRDDPGQQIADQRAFDATAVAHRVLLQVLGQLRLDTVGDKTPLTAGQRLLERALDAPLGYRQLIDAPLFQVLLELAVGNGRHFLPDRQQILQADEYQNGDHPIIHVELSPVFHTLLLLPRPRSAVQTPELCPLPGRQTWAQISSGATTAHRAHQALRPARPLRQRAAAAYPAKRWREDPAWDISAPPLRSDPAGSNRR